MKQSWSTTSIGTLAGAAGVALGSFLLALPRVLSAWNVSPDTIEFIGIANNWVHGRGWLDPVLYSTFLPGALPPVHGMVVRPPGISLLMAPAIALGASLPQLQLVQSAAAALVAGLSVIVARRSVSLASAIAFGIALSWSPSWIAYSSQVLSEPLAIGALLLLVAAIPGAACRPARAARLGLLAVLAWLTRPNLALVLVGFAMPIWLVGDRRVRSGRNVAIAVVVFAMAVAAIHWYVIEATGFAPFAHYGLLLQSTHPLESAAFERSWPGFLAYVMENADRVWATLAAAHSELFSIWFLQPSQLFVGWLVLPACVYAFRRRPARMASQAVALSGLGLLLVVLAFYGGPDPERLGLPAAACFWLLAIEMLDALAKRWRERLPRSPVGATGKGGGRATRSLVAGLPVYVVLAAFGASLGMTDWIAQSRSELASYREEGSLPPGGMYPKIPASVCQLVDKDAVVAASHPWNFYLWCGNAAMWLPPDLTTPAVLQRYLDEKKPGYIISNPSRDSPFEVRRPKLEPLLVQSERLAKVARRSGLSIYRVRGAVAPDGWDAPPPIPEAGR